MQGHLKTFKAAAITYILTHLIEHLDHIEISNNVNINIISTWLKYSWVLGNYYMTLLGLICMTLD